VTDWWNGAIAIATVLTALAGAVAAWAAWQSARQTRKAAEAALVSRLLRDYSAPEMAQALQTLHAWADRYGRDFADAWEAAWGEGNSEAKTVDDARRRVSGYFGTAIRLYEHKMISKGSLKLVAGVAGLHAVRDYLLELEPRVNRRDARLKPYHDLFVLCELESIPLPTRGRFGGLKHKK
jgi:hypothetical protein